MTKEKYLYFMEQTDGLFNAADDAVAYPLSSFLGFQITGTTTTLKMNFKGVADAAGTAVADVVTLTITANKQKETIEEITSVFNRDADGFIVIGDASASANKWASQYVTAVSLSIGAAGTILSTNVTQKTAEVTLTATEIVGTAAGDLGHAAGAVLVAAPGAGIALQFVNAVVIYDYDTAAYTGGAGDDLLISQGTTPVSASIATADLITATADKIIQLEPLSLDVTLTENSTLNLSSTAVTQPGTAAGVIRVNITYNEITTGL